MGKNYDRGSYTKEMQDDSFLDIVLLVRVVSCQSISKYLRIDILLDP